MFTASAGGRASPAAGGCASCAIGAGVSLTHALVGDRVIIHPGCRIGQDGFGYLLSEAKHAKIPQVGRVIIQDEVEIGAGSTIDRGAIRDTVIGEGTKIDNLVQVGHSCTVGCDTLLCAQVGLAGSSHVGSRVILAGQVGVAGHLTIGDDAVMMAQAGTFKDIPAGSIMSGGVPAFEHRESLKVMSIFPKLPEMQRTLRTLEARLKALEQSLSNKESAINEANRE